MGYMIKKILMIFLCLSMAGCITTRHNIALDGGPQGERKFMDLSDEEALQMVVMLHNVTPAISEDVIAKSIAIVEYTRELKKRKSQYIESSGILELASKELDLDEWTDKEIVEMYRLLDYQVSIYKDAKIEEFSEEERALRVIRITAKNAIFLEGKKRDLLRSFMDIFGQVLLIAVNVALSAI